VDGQKHQTGGHRMAGCLPSRASAYAPAI
jgi:hypothetical protein